MTITRTSIYTGKTRTKDLPITPEQWTAYCAGTLIQRAFPHLSADDREFIISGVTDGEWEELWEKVKEKEDEV